MAESYSVKAILSAQDRGFKSVFGAATKSAKELKSTLMGGVGFGAMMAIGQKAVSAVSGSLSGLTKETINTSDAMQKLQQAMRFSGYAEDEIQRIAGATGTLKTYADKTVFSLQDVMSTFGSLSANGVNDAEKLTEAVGNAVAVFGGGAQEFSSVALAFSQAMASGALHAEDWNQIVSASPQLAGGLRKELIKLNPILGEDFKEAMKDGAITADLLGQAMNNIGMTDMAKEAAQSVKTFEGAMGNLEATVTSGLMSLYDSFAKNKVIDAINGFNKKVESAFQKIQTEIPKLITKSIPYLDILKNDFNRIASAFKSAFSSIRTELAKIVPAFGSLESIGNFRDLMNEITTGFETFSSFLVKHAETVAKLISMIPKFVLAIKGFKIVKPLIPIVAGFAGAILKLGAKAVSGIAKKLFGISKGQEAVGKSSASSSKKMMASAKSFMMLGAGVALISGGFFLLAQGAKAVADSGPLAVGVLAGMAGAVLALSFGFMSFLKNVKTSPKKMEAASESFVKMSLAVSAVVLSLAGLALALKPLASLGDTAVAPLAAFGVVVGSLAVIFGIFGDSLKRNTSAVLTFAGAVSVMALAMLPLAKTGAEGAVAMAVFGVVIAGLVAVFAIFGTALTAAVPAMIAFGATILMIGAGMNFATPFVAALGNVIKILGDVFVQAMNAIANAIVAAFPVFGNFVTTVSDSVSQIVSVVGGTFVNVFKTAGEIITGVIDSLGEGFQKITDGITNVINAISGGFTSVLDSVAGIIESIGTSAKNAGLGFESVADGINTLADLSIADIAKALGSVAIGLGEISSKGKNIGVVADGLNAVIGSITLAASQFAILTGNLTKLNSIATALPASIAIINGSLSNFTIPTIDISGIIGAFAAIGTSAIALASQLKNAGTQAGTGFSMALKSGIKTAQNAITSGVARITSESNKLVPMFRNAANKSMSVFNSALSSGASRAIATANMMSVSIVAALSSAAPGAYSSGLSIGINFANGLAASLGRIQSIAAQMSAAASSAAAAKASMPKTRSIVPAETVMEPMAATYGLTYTMDRSIDVPTIASVDPVRNTHVNTSSGGRELSDEYNYRGNVTYTFVVTSELDGKEIAKATAVYTQDELEKLEKRKMRRQGYRNV